MSNLCHLTSFVLYNLSSKFSVNFFWLTNVLVPYRSHLDSSSSFAEIPLLTVLGSLSFRQSIVVLLKCPSKTSLKPRSCKFWRVVFPALAYLRHHFSSYHSISLTRKQIKANQKFHSFKAVLGIQG